MLLGECSNDILLSMLIELEGAAKKYQRDEKHTVDKNMVQGKKKIIIEKRTLILEKQIWQKKKLGNEELAKIITDDEKKTSKHKKKGIEKKFTDLLKKKDDQLGRNNLFEEAYLKHTQLYSDFMNQYLSMSQSIKNNYEAYSNSQKTTRTFSWGDEIINYKERKEMVRVVQMNALMQGEHNHIDPDTKERYELWKYASKFNLLMSFMMYEKALTYS